MATYLNEKGFEGERVGGMRTQPLRVNIIDEVVVRIHTPPAAAFIQREAIHCMLQGYTCDASVIIILAFLVVDCWHTSALA